MNDKLLKMLLCANQDILLKGLPKMLRKFYGEVEVTNDYIIAKGNEVGLVAHLDTVYTQPPTEESLYFDQEKEVLWSPNGLGADDRAGVYIILKLIQMGETPTVILTTKEEVGGLGARALIKKHPNNYLNLKYLIELDRQGKDDCVFYKCRNSDFEDYIESFQFTSTWGTFSDISIIAPAWGIAAVNLSVGYFDEHSYAERLELREMRKTLKKVQKMLKDIPNISTFEYQGAIDLKIYNRQCSMCGQPAKDDAVFLVRDSHTGQLKDMCIDCYCMLTKYIEWCNTCNCAYLTYNKGGCPYCTKK